MGWWVVVSMQKFWIASAAAFAVLLLGSAATWMIGRLSPGVDISNLRQRVCTWWWIVPLLSVVLALGASAVALLFAVTSVLALREYEAMAGVSERSGAGKGQVITIILLTAQFYLSHRPTGQYHLIDK